MGTGRISLDGRAGDSSHEALRDGESLGLQVTCCSRSSAPKRGRPAPSLLINGRDDFSAEPTIANAIPLPTSSAFRFGGPWRPFGSRGGRPRSLTG